VEEHGGRMGGSSGLALLIAVIALILALIALVRGGPTQAELQNMMQVQFDSFSQQLISQFRVSMDKIQKLERELKILEIQKTRARLRDMEPQLTDEQKAELQKIYRSLDAIEASLGGKVAPAPAQPESAP